MYSSQLDSTIPKIELGYPSTLLHLSIKKNLQEIVAVLDDRRTTLLGSRSLQSRNAREEGLGPPCAIGNFARKSDVIANIPAGATYILAPSGAV